MALGVVTQLGFALLIYVNYGRTVRETRNIVQRELRSLVLVTDLDGLVRDMVADVRGFSETGDEILLERYFSAERKFPSLFAELTPLLHDPEEVGAVESLRTMIEQWLTTFAQPRIAIVREQKLGAAGGAPIPPEFPPSLQLAVGKSQVDAIQAKAKWLRALEERQSVEAAEKVVKAETRLTRFLWLAAGGSAVAFLVVSMTLFRAYRREAAVLFAGMDAAERGEYRFLPLQSGNELGQIARVFNRVVSEVQRRDEELRDAHHALLAKHREVVESQEERFRRSFSVSPVAMSLSEAKTGLIVDANERLARLLGYDREELIGHSAVDVGFWVDPLEQAQVVAEVETFVPIREREVRLRTKSGEIRHVLGSIEPLAVGEETVLLSVFQDITERKRAEEALRASEARYRSLFERNLAGVYRSTREGRILECNEALARMFGYESRDDILGRSAADLYPDPQRRSEFLDALDRTGVLSNYEGRYRRKDGSDLWTLESTALVPAETGGGTVIEGTVINVTERRQLEEQLRQSQKMEAIGQLAGGVAHDFNNLLTAILGYTELLALRADIQEAAREEIDEIRQAGKRAAVLTRQLLAFSRKQVLAPVVLGVNELVGNLEKMLRRLIGEDVELVTRLEPSVSNVRADPGQLEQVIMNLVVNARDAMPGGGSLTIETADADPDEAYSQRHVAVEPGHYVMVAVSDTGIGMDSATQARIFEPFFTTKEKGKGTGLGLSTAYGIVKQSGGYIWVYSEPGRGTTFKVYLPSVAAASAVRGARVFAADGGKGSETILLVEDEPSVRTLSRRILEARGYRVLEAGKGAEALELVRGTADPIHLVLTDLVMPEMSGNELASRVLALRPGVRVLYMSGYTDDAAARNGLLEGDRAFLQKPFTPEVLARKVREVLEASPAS